MGNAFDRVEKCFCNARAKEGFILSTPEKWGKPEGKANPL